MTALRLAIALRCVLSLLATTISGVALAQTTPAAPAATAPATPDTATAPAQTPDEEGSEDGYSSSEPDK